MTSFLVACVSSFARRQLSSGPLISTDETYQNVGPGPRGPLIAPPVDYGGKCTTVINSQLSSVSKMQLTWYGVL